MLIVTWNMGCGYRASEFRKRHVDAWSYLIHELQPDVAFVQEAVRARLDEAARDYFAAHCDLDPKVDAGTSVLVRGDGAGAAGSLAVGSSTYIATAGVTTPSGALQAVGVHVYPGDRLHADLAALADVAGTSFKNAPALIGGDFNASRRFDVVYGGDKHQRFFDRMAAAGFHDVHWGLHGREVKTFWGRKAKEAYQDDHFFISKAWVPRVRACHAVDYERVRGLSDHVPLVLELDATAA